MKKRTCKSRWNNSL